MATRKIFANQEFQPSASLVNPKVHVITDLSQHSGSVGQLVTYSANLYFHDGSNWFTLIESNYSGNLTGAPNFDPSSGSVPFTVGSGNTGRVDNLNADYLDGYDTSTTATSSAIPVYGSGGVLNVGTPTGDTHAATKLYVDNAIQGLDIKPSVAAATTASITLSGNQTIDGVSITAGMRVLVKDQSTASENGIYVSSASAWALAEDSDSQSLSDGAYVFVENGTTHNNTGWTYVNDGAYTWVQFSGAGQITAGDGLTKTGDTLNASVASPLSISNDQITIADGDISGVKLDSAIAGDGLAFTTGVLSVNVSGPISISNGSLGISDGAIGGAKLNTAIAGDGLGISAGVLSINTTGPISVVNDYLTISDGAITGAKLDSAIAGNGIGFGSGVMSINTAGPITIVNDLVTIQDGALTGAKLADNTVTSTQLANSITVTDLLVQDVSLATLIVGSTGGAGAELILDGAANGDGSGGDFAYIKMTSGDDLHIVNQQTAGTMLFATGSVTRATIAADGKVKLFQNTAIGGDPSSTYTLYAYGDSKIGGTLETTRLGIGSAPDSAITLLVNGSTQNSEYARLGNNSQRHLRLSSFSVSGNANAGHDINASSSYGQITLSTGSSAVLRADQNKRVSIGDFGTANAGSNLHVWADDTVIASFQRNDSNSGYIVVGNSTTGLFNGSYGGGILLGVDINERGILWNRSNTDLAIGTNNIERLTIYAGGDIKAHNRLAVGGSVNTNYQLYVVGDSMIDGTLVVDSPTLSTEAATKGYVDTALAGASYDNLDAGNGITIVDTTVSVRVDSPLSFTSDGSSDGTLTIADGALTGAKLANNTVTTTQLSDDITLSSLEVGTPHANEDQSSNLIVSQSVAGSTTHDFITFASVANNAGTTSRILFKDRYGTTSFPNGQESSFIASERATSAGTYSLVFGTAGSSSADAVERFRLTSSGNILPGADASYSIGSSSLRFYEVASTRFSAADGSESSPTFRFINDTDTGLFRSGSDTINFSTGGSERMRLTSTGLGIGCAPTELLTLKGQGQSVPTFAIQRTYTTDTQFRITLAENSAATTTRGTSTGQWANVIDSTNSNLFLTSKNAGGTGGSIILDADKVGVGTVPSESLHVNGNARIFSSGYPYIDLGISTSNYWRIINDNPNDALKIGKNGAADIAISGGKTHIKGAGSYLVNAGTGELQIGYALASQGGTSGTVTRLAIQPYAHTGGPWKFDARDVGGSAYLDIKYGSNNGISLLHDGSVGIRTATPSYNFHVEGISYLNPTSANSTLILGRYSGQRSIKAGSDDGGYLIMDSSGDGTGKAALNWYSGDDVVLALGGGSVGVGTTNPGTEKLYVDTGSSTFNRGNSAGDIVHFRGQNAEKAVIGTATSYFLSDVGIGTASPSHKLHVNDDSTVSLANQPKVIAEFTGTGTDGRNLISVTHEQSGTASALGAGIRFRTRVDTSGTAGYLNSYIFQNAPNQGHDLIYVAPKNMSFYVDGHDNDLTGTTYTDFGTHALELDEDGDLRVINSLGIGVDPSGASLDVKSNIIVRDTDSNDEHIQLFTNGTEGVMRLRNGANWGFIARGSANNPYIGAYSGGSLNIVGFTSSNGSSFNSTLAQFDFTNQRVSIGTTNPDATLHINGTSAAGWDRGILLSMDGTNLGRIVPDNEGIKYRTAVSGDHHWFRNSSNATTLLIKDDGKMGLGTTNPDGLLHLNASSQVSQYLTTTLNSGTGSRIRFEHFRTSGATGYGDDLGTLDFAFKDSAGNEDVGVRMVSRLGGSSGDNTSGQERSRFLIQTLKGSSTLTDSIEINRVGNILLSNGNVGIGTAGPNYRLTVASPNTIAPFALINSSNSNRRYLAVTSQSNNPNLALFNSSETSTIELNTNGDSFLNGGNVGIGTSSPGSYKLYVNGNTFLSGDTYTSVLYQNSQKVLAERYFEVSLPAASGYSASYFYPVYFNTGFNNVNYHTGEFSIEMSSQSASAAYNSNIMYGRVVGGGWTDHKSYANVYQNYYDENERSILGIYRGTQNSYGYVIYLRGGTTYKIKTDSTSVTQYLTAATIGSSVYAIKNANHSDYSGTSTNISMLYNAISYKKGSYSTDTGYFPSIGINTTDPGSYKLLVAGVTRLGSGDYGTSQILSIAPGTIDFDAPGSTGGRLKISSSGYVFNEVGASVDFRVEGDTDPNLLFLDGSADRVGIGTASPGYKLQVVGDVRISTGDCFLDDTRSIKWGGNDSRIDGSSGGDYLRFYTNGSERMRIISGGNVGIGTTSPNAKLEIAGDTRSGGRILYGGTESNYLTGVSYASIYGTADTFESVSGLFGSLVLQSRSNTARPILFVTGSTPSEKMRLTSDGALGLGTTSPDYKLDVRDSSNATRIVVRNDNNAGGGAGIYMRTFNGTTQVSNATVRTNNTGIFSIFNGAGSESENFSISAAGDVHVHNELGIGTASPSAQLHIKNSTSNSYAALRLEGTNRGGYISFYNQSYPVSEFLTDQSGNIYFSTSGGFASTSLSTKLTLSTGGNLGIGTVSPYNTNSVKLDVRGAINFDNNALIAGGANTTNNIDHIWHNDGSAGGAGGTWNFCSDTTYKASGNSRVAAGHFYANSQSQTSVFAGHVSINNSGTGTTPLNVYAGSGESIRFWRSNSADLNIAFGTSGADISGGGSIAFRANGSTVNSLTITSSQITLNENVSATGDVDVAGTLDVSDISVNGTTTANRYLGTNSSGTLEWKTASSNPYITNISMGGFVVSTNRDWVNVNTTLTYNNGSTISDSATIVMTTLNCPDDCATGS